MVKKIRCHCEAAKRPKQSLLIVFLVLFAGGIISTIYAGEGKNIILATTTSVQDTGLLDVLVEAFKKNSGQSIKAIAVGSGQAMKLGKTGEADILLVHSPQDELEFMDEGFGTERVTFMHNDFVLLGPKSDPAKAAGAKTALDAFKRIAEKKALFVSRGDNSGTHKKEIKLWQEAGVRPDKEAYIETGQGMSATAAVVSEKQGYCLADRGTYLSLKKSLDLVIVYEGDISLRNNYSLMLVNPQKFPKVNDEGAKSFLNFILSKEAKGIIENFGKAQYGAPLFFHDYTQ